MSNPLSIPYPFLAIGVSTSGNAPGEGHSTLSNPHYFPMQPGGGGVGDAIDRCISHNCMHLNYDIVHPHGHVRMHFATLPCTCICAYLCRNGVLEYLIKITTDSKPKYASWFPIHASIFVV